MNTADPVLDALRAALAAGRAPDPQVRRALAEHDDPAVLRQAGRLLARSPIADRALPAIRVAILATGTIGPYEHLLRACLAGGGFRPEIAPGDYGAFEVTLATAGHPGDAPPDLVATVLDESYFLPRDWDADDLDGLEKHVETRLADFQGLVTVGVAGTSATLVLHTIPLPGEIRDTFIGWRPRARMARLWHRVNAAILELADEHAQVAAVDLVGVLADTPVAARDARLHRYGDLPYTDGALLALAQQVRRVAQARYGLSRKVLAVDLDNTLWGGVVGEVGAGGVELGGLYPGNCYLELQRAIRRLRQQGVVLV